MPAFLCVRLPLLPSPPARSLPFRPTSRSTNTHPVTHKETTPLQTFRVFRVFRGSHTPHHLIGRRGKGVGRREKGVDISFCIIYYIFSIFIERFFVLSASHATNSSSHFYLLRFKFPADLKAENRRGRKYAENTRPPLSSSAAFPSLAVQISSGA